MDLHLFTSVTGMGKAVSNDETGDNLPEIKGGWSYNGSRDIPPTGDLIGAKCEDIHAAVKAKGFYLYPDDAKKPPASPPEG